MPRQNGSYHSNRRNSTNKHQIQTSTTSNALLLIETGYKRLRRWHLKILISVPDEAPKPRLPDPIDQRIAVMPPSRIPEAQKSNAYSTPTQRRGILIKPASSEVVLTSERERDQLGCACE
ncbi:hypothetical protein TNCV_3166361 [Trichonephila clavipes]|uniref:Uncharacterized protein n=1 Tax=Trichonephila clavipes TaxID=2585209 RepID=A0A8X6RB16_TRICX|nr:hypothetical protein TNCV_3166361 [Trichonephila clavipes]